MLQSLSMNDFRILSSASLMPIESILRSMIPSGSYFSTHMFSNAFGRSNICKVNEEC